MLQSTIATPISNELERKHALLQDMESLLKQRKLLKARTNFKDFCEYVIKDEQSGTKIQIGDLQQSWIDHIGFCKNNNLHALILAPMASGKCVHEDTEFITPDKKVYAKDLRTGMEVLAFDTDSRKPKWALVVDAEPQPQKEVYFLKLDTGKSVTVTHDHKFYCNTYKSSDWVAAEDLTLDDHVYTPANWADEGVDGNWYGLGLFQYNQNEKPNYVDEEQLFTFTRRDDVTFNRTVYERDKHIEMETTLIEPLSLGREALKTFFAGVLDAIGNYNAGLRMYELTHRSREALEEHQTILQSLGIPSRIVRRLKPHETVYNLLISREFSGNVNEMFNCRVTQLHSLAKVKTSDPRNFFIERIVECRSLGMASTIGVQTTNSTHITNGIVSHNTQIVSVALPLYLIGRDTSVQIKMVCLSDDAAKERHGAIKAYLMEDPDYKEVFPKVKKDNFSEWSKHNLTVDRIAKGAKDPTLSAKGVTSGGIGGRCNILLVDDIFDFRTAIAQPATREQICATYNLVWLTRLYPKNSMAVVICTRWHEQDLAGLILGDEKMRNQYGILIQAVASDFSGIDIKAVIPDNLVEKYTKALPNFTVIK